MPAWEIFSYREEEAFLFQGLAYPWEALRELEERLQKFLPSGLEVGEGVTLEGVFCHCSRLLISTQAIVEPTVVIQGGPVFIGPQAQLRAGAYIRGPAYIGAGAVVGHATEVKNSILLAEAKAPHFNYVGDSILGPRVNLGAGTKLGNVRLDEGTVRVFWHGERINTGMKKLGALIGDGASLGCNAVCNPGTILFPGVQVHPGVAVGGTHFSGVLGRRRGREPITPRETG